MTTETVQTYQQGTGVLISTRTIEAPDPEPDQHQLEHMETRKHIERLAERIDALEATITKHIKVHPEG